MPCKISCSCRWTTSSIAFIFYVYHNIPFLWHLQIHTIRLPTHTEDEKWIPGFILCTSHTVYIIGAQALANNWTHTYGGHTNAPLCWSLSRYVYSNQGSYVRLLQVNSVFYIAIQLTSRRVHGVCRVGGKWNTQHHHSQIIRIQQNSHICCIFCETARTIWRFNEDDLHIHGR